jgi:hypothetical protein
MDVVDTEALAGIGMRMLVQDSTDKVADPVQDAIAWMSEESKRHSGYPIQFSLRLDEHALPVIYGPGSNFLVATIKENDIQFIKESIDIFNASNQTFRQRLS